MVNVQKYIFSIGLLSIFGLYGLTSQGFIKIKTLEDELNNKQTIIKNLDQKIQLTKTKDISSLSEQGYGLTFASIIKLEEEINTILTELNKLDSAAAVAKVKEAGSALQILNSWIVQGKVGIEEVSTGIEKISMYNLYDLKTAVGRVIEDIKASITGERNDVRIKTLSALLDVCFKNYDIYISRINVQYPVIGFDTKDIFIGYDAAGKNVFSELNDNIQFITNKLKNATDSTGKLIFELGSPVAEELKTKVVTIERKRLTMLSEVLYRIVSVVVVDIISPFGSPWMYVERNFFRPLLEITDNQKIDIGKLTADQKRNVSLKNIIDNQAKKNELKCFNDMLLLKDAANVIDYLAKNMISIKNDENERALLKLFTATYARLTVFALLYAQRLGDIYKEKLPEYAGIKNFFNQYVFESVTQSKKDFILFYTAQKQAFDLEKVPVDFVYPQFDLLQFSFFRIDSIFNLELIKTIGQAVTFINSINLEKLL